jgi:hypothetical protein
LCGGRAVAVVLLVLLVAVRGWVRVVPISVAMCARTTPQRQSQVVN